MSIHVLRSGIDGVPDVQHIPACENSKERIHQILIRLISSDEKFTGEDILKMYEEAGRDVPRILELLQDVSLDDARRRAIWMVAWYFNETRCLHVPVEFLPDFEKCGRERDRTKAYCFHQAYLLSKGMCADYLKQRDMGGFYHELTNLIIACQNLHNLEVNPDSVITIGSCFPTFLAEATVYRWVLTEWIKDFCIQKTPEIAELLDKPLLRVV